MAADWGYSPTNGPEVWARLFPQAGGARQSPVDICTAIASSDSDLEVRKLTAVYESQSGLRILNTGHGWKVEAPQTESVLEGGPLGDDIYRLEQFHCHWGETTDEGSEHTVDGKAFAGELHLVHWNTTKYQSFAEAAQHPDGLAVLGVFFEVGNESNSEMEKIAASLAEIKFKGQFTEVTDVIDPAKLLPDGLGYWTYLGSLTTPPCNECVTWIVFKQPITVTEQQLAQMRHLSNSGESEEFVVKNYRPPQPLGNRALRECTAA
ncbi:carbonic anhydrase 1 [Neocloeon triangulifer]|uniref:carbonic anhydrase 1 n=1 Tax=Neocloeon triangulifer TaxID=2078957 RepID=UPI00286F4FD4|nr:carbonic anhydrase 1 [Neocloeon triangulifer]